MSRCNWKCCVQMASLDKSDGNESWFNRVDTINQRMKFIPDTTRVPWWVELNQTYPWNYWASAQFTLTLLKF